MQERHLREAARYRFEINNDVLFDSDNQFSKALSKDEIRVVGLVGR